MSGYIKLFERWVTLVLIVMMAIVVVLSVIELGWLLIKDVTTPPMFILEVDELIEIFATFLLVLIGIELLETLKAYFLHEEIRAEVIILAALIALARKVITLDFKDVPGLSLLGLAAIILALVVAYFFIRKSRVPENV